MMKKFKCEIKPYRLYFKKEVKTSRSSMKHRDIWTVRICDNFGRDGYGEVAPLENLSVELNEKFEDKLNDVSEHIEFYLENKAELIPYPSILFGIESAWLSYKHRDFVFYKTPFTQHERKIPINALVWMGDYQDMKTQVDEILKKETQCIKLKIGGINWDEEVELLKYIRKYRSQKTLEIRLDANGSFSKEEALTKLDYLSRFQIHSIEQPIKQRQYETMAKLIHQSPIPVALDEELIGIFSFQDKKKFLDRLRPPYIVLKPSLHGGFMGCEEWIFLANTTGVDWWVTSSLESNIGLNALAQWCSRYDRCYDRPQGLGTGDLYENNFPTHLALQDYKLTLAK